MDPSIETFVVVPVSSTPRVAVHDEIVASSAIIVNTVTDLIV